MNVREIREQSEAQVERAITQQERSLQPQDNQTAEIPSQEPLPKNEVTRAISQLPQNQLMDDVVVDSIRQKAVDKLYHDEVELAREENAGATEDQRLFDPTTSTDATPYSDFLPVLRTPRQKEQLNNWRQQIPDSSGAQQSFLRQTLGIAPDTPAQSIAGLPNGYSFGYSRTQPLLGECAFMAQQWTSLANGQNWTIGSSIQEKRNQLAGHIKNGNGFYIGQGIPTAGNTIVFNGGKYGHVAVIAEIKNGKARLEEANYNNDHRYTNTRWVSLDDPTILGFLTTVKRGK